MKPSECFLSYDEVRIKLESWCGYRDRCTSEILLKIQSFSLSEKEVSHLTDHLKDMRFLDDERFSVSFVSGKFRIKRWGRKKIYLHLLQKKIGKELIANALSQIDDEEYMKTIDYWLEKKSALLNKEKDAWKKQQKILQFVASKGFEIDLILDRLKLLNS